MREPFKQQFVNYATGKLQMMVSSTSANCNHQVLQEMTNTFACLCQQIENTQRHLEEVPRCSNEIDQLEEIQNNSKLLKLFNLKVSGKILLSPLYIQAMKKSLYNRDRFGDNHRSIWNLDNLGQLLLLWNDFKYKLYLLYLANSCVDSGNDLPQGVCISEKCYDVSLVLIFS